MAVVGYAIVGQAAVEIRAKTDKFEDDVKKAGAAVGQTSGAFSKLTGFVSKAETSLNKMGITSQQLAVVLGAGLAGGAAFAAREVLQFGIEAVQAAARLEDARNLSERVFGEQAESIQEFASTASASMGLSERAALAAASGFGLFAINIGLPQEAAAGLSTSLTTLAADISSAQADFVKTEDVLHALKRALVGEFDPLEQFGVTLTQTALKAKAVELGIAKAGDELTVTQKAVAAYGAILEQTEIIQGDFAATSDSLPNQMNRFTAATEDAKAALGELFLPTVAKAASDLNDLFQAFNTAAKGIKEWAEEVEQQFGAVIDIFQFLHDAASDPAMKLVRRLLDLFTSGSEEAAEGSNKLTSAEELAEKSSGALAKQTAKTTEEINRAADARKRYVRAIEDSERRVDRAEETLARALEDSELRIDKAERALAEAFEDRAERIADAEQNLADQRLEGFRAVRDARENLEDFERESSKRIQDAERGVAQARRERTKAIQEARFALEAAMRAGDAEAENEARRRLKDASDTQSVADAERRLAEEKAERDREGARLERELAEARMDAAEDVKRAQIDLARVYDDTAEKIEEAQRNIRDAHRDSERAIADAQRGMRDAMREGEEAVLDAGTALERLADDAERARTALQLLRDEAERVADILLDPVFLEDIPEGSLADILLNPNIEQNAAGGGLNVGAYSVVGERGPELIRSNSNATVVPNDQLLAVLRQLSGSIGSIGGGASVQVIVPHQDARVLANELSYRMAREVN